MPWASDAAAGAARSARPRYHARATPPAATADQPAGSPLSVPLPTIHVVPRVTACSSATTGSQPRPLRSISTVKKTNNPSIIAYEPWWMTAWYVPNSSRHQITTVRASQPPSRARSWTGFGARRRTTTRARAATGSHQVSALRLAAVAGGPAVAPTAAAVYQNRYPVRRPVLVCQLGEPGSGLQAGFVAFLTSPRGQIVVESEGLVPKTVPERAIQLR